MERIKDRLLLGTIAGIGGNLVKEAIAETSIRLGLTKYSCRRMIPLIVLSKKEAKTWKGWAIGTTTDFAVACATGTLLVYTLTHTGKDYPWLKGALVSNGILDQLFNVFSRILPAVQREPNSNLICKMIHTIFGITAVSIITTLGSETLFKEAPHQLEREASKNTNEEATSNSAIVYYEK